MNTINVINDLAILDAEPCMIISGRNASYLSHLKTVPIGRGCTHEKEKSRRKNKSMFWGRIRYTVFYRNGFGRCRIFGCTQGRAVIDKRFNPGLSSCTCHAWTSTTCKDVIPCESRETSRFREMFLQGHTIIRVPEKQIKKWSVARRRKVSEEV